MRKEAIFFDYIKRTAPIWVLFIICIYSIVACEFESLRIRLPSLFNDVAYVNKTNDIIKNLSFSYIAGVIFFFLSDTIPFLRRKRVVYKNVEKSMRLMVAAIDDFSHIVNNKIWDEKTDASTEYEEFSGAEYSDNMPPIKLQIPFCIQLKELVEKLNLCINFVISQELYVSSKLLNDFELIKNNDNYLFINSKSIDDYVNPEKIVKAFAYLIEIKCKINQHLYNYANTRIQRINKSPERQ